MDGLCHIVLHLRIEDELLLACAGINLGGGQYEAIRRLASECKDWDYLLQAARFHGLTSLLSSNLEIAAADIVPCKALEVLRSRFRANAARNLFLTQELLSLIGQFGTQGIEVIPLKGPLLALTAYGNVALREFLDLDILVPKEDLYQAGGVLVKCGYQQQADQAGENRSIHVETQLGCDFVRKDGRVSVEMHWSFLQRWLGFKVDLDALWKAPDHVSVGGIKVLSLPAEIGLLYLCSHGAKHRWSRLCWVVDVAQSLKAQPELNWEKLLETAKRTGCRRTFFLGLHLAHTLLGAELPQKVWSQMTSDASADALAQEICDQLLPAKINGAVISEGWANDWFYLRTKERWTDRLIYLRYLAAWLLLPSQKDKKWISLPARLGWLYIFLRPIRAACDVIHPRSHDDAGAPPR